MAKPMSLKQFYILEERVLLAEADCRCVSDRKAVAYCYRAASTAVSTSCSGAENLQIVDALKQELFAEIDVISKQFLHSGRRCAVIRLHSQLYSPAWGTDKLQML